MKEPMQQALLPQQRIKILRRHAKTALRLHVRLWMDYGATFGPKSDEPIAERAARWRGNTERRLAESDEHLRNARSIARLLLRSQRGRHALGKIGCTAGTPDTVVDWFWHEV